MENQELQEELTAVSVSDEDLATLKEMMAAGLMYGHKKSKTNPKFKQYIFSTRNGVEIIDLGQTLSALETAAEFAKNQIKDKKMILFVATQPAAREAVEALANKFNLSYINERWIGGLLTNFKIVGQRIEHFKKTQADLEKGKFDKYTKKERVMISRDVERMKKIFTGLENMSKLPDAIFIVDPSIKGHMIALREAKITNVPIIAILDSDDDPDSVDYPIPANDHSKSSINWIIDKIEEKL